MQIGWGTFAALRTLTIAAMTEAATTTKHDNNNQDYCNGAHTGATTQRQQKLQESELELEHQHHHHQHQHTTHNTTNWAYLGAFYLGWEGGEGEGKGHGVDSRHPVAIFCVRDNARGKSLIVLPGEHTNNKRKKKKEKKTWFRKRTEINWQKRRQHKMSCVFIALLLDGVILAIIVIAAHGY